MAEWEVPRSEAEWHAFCALAEDDGRYYWYEGSGIEVRWPLDPPFTDGPTWVPSAEDHPFKGTHFCWRCVAEARGNPSPQVPHCREGAGICWWQEAGGQPPAQDAVPDTRPTGDPDSSDWTEAGRQYVAEAVDTGTIWYEPPVKPVEGSRIRIQRLDPEGHPVGPAQEGIVRSSVWSADAGEALTWDGFPSWTEDLPVPDFPEWPPPAVEIPLSRDEFETLHGPVEADPQGDPGAVPAVPEWPSPDPGDPVDS